MVMIEKHADQCDLGFEVYSSRMQNYLILVFKFLLDLRWDFGKFVTTAKSKLVYPKNRGAQVSMDFT